MKDRTKATVTVTTVLHPNPQRLVDVFAGLVVDELLREERNSEPKSKGEVETCQ